MSVTLSSEFFPSTQMLHPSSQFANGAYLSVDWATIVCQNCSIRQLLHLLKLQKYSRTSFKKEELRIHTGLDAFAFDINGVQFCVNRTVIACFGLDPESNDIFDYVFDSVRVNFTGSGLRFMRSELMAHHICADQYILYFFTMNDAPKGHFTRLDFALDIVNDFSNILGNIVQHMQYGGIDEYGSVCSGKFTAGQRPYRTKLWLDPENNGVTAYIGSNSSDQMLRVYNKYAESRDFVVVDGKRFESWKPGKAPDFPGIEVDSVRSWVRFELVLRNKKAMQYTPIDAVSQSVLDHPSFFAREIRQKFAPVSSSLQGEAYRDWWLQFWKVLEVDDKVQILYNQEYDQKEFNPLVRIANYCATTASVNWLIASCACTPQFMLAYQQRLLLWIQLSLKGNANKSWHKFKQAFTSAGIVIDDDLGLVWNESLNAWCFPDIKPLNKDDCVNQVQRQFGSVFGWSWDHQTV